jgi:hypothetical protein
VTIQGADQVRNTALTPRARHDRRQNLRAYVRRDGGPSFANPGRADLHGR